MNIITNKHNFYKLKPIYPTIKRLREKCYLGSRCKDGSNINQYFP